MSELTIQARLTRISQVLCFIALAVVVIATLKPNTGAAPVISINDKILHFVAYAGLGFLGGMGWPRREALLLLIMPLIGLALEHVQGAFIEGRYFEWADAGANALGAVFGVVASIVVLRALPKLT